MPHMKGMERSCYELLFRQAPIRLLVLEACAPFHIRDVTDSYLEATFTKRDIVGRPIFDIFPSNPDDASATGVHDLTASFERALASRTTDTMPVLKYDIRDRSGAFVERHWTPVNATVVDGDGSRVAIVHRTEDVTSFVKEGEVLRGEAARLGHEILSRGRDLALANKALRDSIEQRRKIAAIVGHDLRGPLATVCMGVELLRRQFEQLGARPPRTVDILRLASSRMEELLSDLDDYSVTRLEGHLSIERQRVNLREICDEVVQAAQVAHPERAIELEPGENILAHVDPKRKRQLLTNLLDNSLTYGAADRPVRISLRRVTGGCVMKVSNEGEPIPEDVIPNLFQPFQRGPGTGSARGSRHLGLGLYIVRQITQAHEGAVDVTSTPQETQFSVFTPS
jgi:signal transduction histidine kinase